MTALEVDIKHFADERFGERDSASRLRKLGEEFGELSEAVARADWDAMRLEAADMAIVLSDLLAIRGMSLDAAMVEKLAIAMKRPPTAKELRR